MSLSQIDDCQTPHPNEDPKDQFGFGVTLKSKSPPTTHPKLFLMVMGSRMYFKTFLLR